MAVYAYLYQQGTTGLTFSPYPEADALFEQYTGVPSTDSTFNTASAILGA